MGVLGLWDVLESVGHPIKVEGLEGKILGVDANIWLYKFIRGFREKDNASNIESHKLGLFNRISKLLYYRIKPVFVFDGPAPVLKRRTLERRQNTRNKQLTKVQDAAMRILANQLKSQYPDADIDHLRITLPNLQSNNLVAAEKLTDEDRELFYLPDTGKLKNSDDEESDASFDDDDDVQFTTAKVDIHSKDFEELPAETRYEILQDIKASRRRIRNYNNLPDDANSFSSLQLERLQARRKVQEKIERAEKDICTNYTGQLADGSSIQAFRVQSDATATILYRNNTYDPKALDPKVKKEDRESQSESADVEDIEKQNVPDPGVALRPSIRDIALKSNALDLQRKLSRSLNTSNTQLKCTAASDRSTSKRGESDTDSDDEFYNLLTQDEVPQARDRDEPTEVENLVEEADIETSSSSSDEVDLSSPKPETQVTHIDSSGSDTEVEEVAPSQPRPPSVLEPSVPSPVILEADIESCRSSSSPGSSQQDLHSTIDLTSPEPVRSRLHAEVVEVTSPPAAPMEPKTNKLSDIQVETIGTSSDEEEEGLQPGESSAPKKRRLDDDEQPTRRSLSQPVQRFLQETTQTTPQRSFCAEASFMDVEEYERGCASQPAGHSAAGGAPAPAGSGRAEPGPAAHSEQRPTVSLCELRAGHSSQELEKAQRSTNRVTNKVVQDAKDLLRLFGIPYLDAAGEAEAQCAKLEELKLTEGTITDDSDIWLFGSQNVFRYFFSDDKYVMQYKMTDIEFHVRMTRENLACFAMLVGSDYTDGIMNVGPVTALEILSEFPGEGMEPLEKFRDWHREALQDKKAIGDKKRKKLLKFRLPEEFPSRTVFEGYLRPVADSSAEQFSWGVPELDELREYARRNFGWDPKKVDEKLLPVMKRLNEKKLQRTIDTFFFKTQANRNPEMFRSKRVNQALNKIAKRGPGKRPAAAAPPVSEVVNLSEDESE